MGIIILSSPPYASIFSVRRIDALLYCYFVTYLLETRKLPFLDLYLCAWKLNIDSSFTITPIVVFTNYLALKPRNQLFVRKHNGLTSFNCSASSYIKRTLVV